MEKFDLENFPTSESAKKMLSYVSDGFYDKSYVGKWIYQVMGIEYDMALEIAEDLPAQFYPETATWGLMYHEIKWGLPVRLNLPYEERRKLIYQKRDYRAPMTPYRMEKYLADVTGFEVHIADINDPGKYGFVPRHPNVFKVYFLGEGSLDAKLIFGILNRLKQSHTTYTVNDRIEIELYNRDLEQIILRNVRFKMGILFWASGRLGLMGGYALRLGIACRGIFTIEEGIGMAVTAFMSDVPLLEKMDAGEQEIHASIGFWRSLHSSSLPSEDEEKPDGCSMQENRMMLQIDAKAAQVSEEFVDATVVSHRNLAYFDGSLLMDGSRLMNSLYKEETI